jgi:hypothetical protein
MSFTILLLAPDADPTWPEKISRAVPGAVARAYAEPNDALADIETADAAYGTVPPELFARRRNCAGSVRPAPASAVPISMMRWSRAMSS